MLVYFNIQAALNSLKKLQLCIWMLHYTFAVYSHKQWPILHMGYYSNMVKQERNKIRPKIKES